MRIEVTSGAVVTKLVAGLCQLCPSREDDVPDNGEDQANNNLAFRAIRKGSRGIEDEMLAMVVARTRVSLGPRC